MGGPSIEPDHTIKHSAEYKCLTTHLSSKPQPLGQALDSFCGPTEDLFMQSKATSEIEAQLWHAWKAIIAAATQTPHDSAGRQKLADFVLALRDRPVLERNGKVCKVWDATVWKELPVFGAAMREAWNAAATDHSHHHARSAWINLNAFAATLVSTQHSATPAPASSDFSLYAIWTIRMALEDSAPSPASDKTSQAAAAAWLAYAAPALLGMSRQGKEFEGKMAKQGQAIEGKEWRGFNEERWGVWEECSSFMSMNICSSRSTGVSERASESTTEKDHQSHRSSHPSFRLH